MSKKVKFYSIKIKNTSSDEEVEDISTLFNEMEEQRIAEKEQEKTNKSKFQHNVHGKEMIFFEFSRDPNDDSHFVIPFGTKKQSSIFKEESDEEMSTKVTEVIGKLYDLSSMYYDIEEKIAILYEEKTSPSAKYIAAYLNMVFQSFKGQSYECKIEPVYYSSGISAVRNAQMVTKIILSLNLSENEEQMYAEHLRVTTLLGTLFEAISSTKKDMKAKTFTLELGVGRGGKKARLDKECVMQLVNSLQLDESIINEVTIVYKNGEKERPKKALLKKEYLGLCYEFKDRSIISINPTYLIAHGKEAIRDKKSQYREYLRNNE